MEVHLQNTPGKGVVLIMDDEDMVCEIARQILEYLDYTVETVSDGKDAIDRYQDMYEKKMPYLAVIMDLNIPGGIGGKEAIGEILDIDPDAKVVVSSGYANDEIMINFGDHGFSGCLEKPFTIESVEQLLESI